MKLKDFRQKYNHLLQRFIRLFSLSSVAFVVTACYGPAPYDYEGYVDIEGQVLDENNQPLESIQVILRNDDENNRFCDTIYTDTDGAFAKQYFEYQVAFSDSIDMVAHDTTGVYASDSVRVSTNQIEHKGFNVNGNVQKHYLSLYTDIQLKKK